MPVIEVCKKTASKYTRSKVRKALPEDFAYVIEELMTERGDITDKDLIMSRLYIPVLHLNATEECIIALCELIQRLVVDHLQYFGRYL